MKLIVAIVRPFKVTEIADAVTHDPAFPGMTVLACRGFGREKSRPHEHLESKDLTDFIAYEMVLVAAADATADALARRLEAVAHTGHAGDGKILVLPLDDVVRIASGERAEDALR